MSGFEQFGDVGRTDPTRCSRDKDRHLRPQHVMSVADSWLPIVTVKVNTTMWAVGRWQPNSRGRLQEAALVLYAQQGFPHATATEIATRADLTEPTFFAHFAGKRKVRFDSSAMLDASIVEGTAGAPDSDRSFDAVERGPSAAVDMLGEFRRDCLANATTSSQQTRSCASGSAPSSPPTPTGWQRSCKNAGCARVGPISRPKRA